MCNICVCIYFEISFGESKDFFCVSESGQCWTFLRGMDCLSQCQSSFEEEQQVVETISAKLPFQTLRIMFEKAADDSSKLVPVVLSPTALKGKRRLVHKLCPPTHYLRQLISAQKLTYSEPADPFQSGYLAIKQSS